MLADEKTGENRVHAHTLRRVGTTWTAASAYTFESAASTNFVGAEDTVAGATGSYTASWTMTPGVNWQNVLISIVSANASASRSANAANCRAADKPFR